MSKWAAGLLVVLFFTLGGLSVFLGNKVKKLEGKNPLTTQTAPSIPPTTQQQQLVVVAQDLEVPWALAFLPDNSIVVTERAGRVRFVDAQGKLLQEPLITIADVEARGEGGLLGIAVHPNFKDNKFVYVYYSYASTNNRLFNRVERYTLEGEKLVSPKIILNAIPGNSNHDGGRIKFGPDGYLYVATGDSQEPSLAQSRVSLAGKILRMTDEGKPALDNPFGNLIYSYGHRNPQGLAWDDKERLWATEHGRSGISSGLDELNLIESGQNYGWPTIEGNETQVGMITPVAHSGSSTTWAPSGAAYYGGSIFFTGLRGEGLYEAVLSGTQATIKKHFDQELGRIREVVLGPDNMLYITTSNRDGRGRPAANDDKIFRVDPKQLP